MDRPGSRTRRPDRPAEDCNLRAQGYDPGSCLVRDGDRQGTACALTVRECGGEPERLINAILLSRPEHYLSIYQSGCNMSCRKCHSWQFSQEAVGTWMSPSEIGGQAIAYDHKVTVREPRERATTWHAHDLCRACGCCVVLNRRPPSCPGVLSPEQVVFSSQGFGPARNILAFTGGDLTCRPRFYTECASLIKQRTDLWVLIETNGHGLTPDNLDELQAAGVDAFWLDIKAHDGDRHRWLTGCGNTRILGLPEQIVRRGFVLEVLSLFIPGVVEAAELGAIADLLAAVDPEIPFTILAFFPAYRMSEYRAPTVDEMVAAYEQARRAGLINVRLGNLGVFAPNPEQRESLKTRVPREAF